MRKKRLTFDNLETRQLMTAGYSPDTANATRISTVAPETMLTGMPPMQPPLNNDPSVSITGGSPNSIGGSVGFSVTPNNPYAMIKIEYSASGALATESFDSSKGDYTAFSGISHDYPNGVQWDMQSVFWDATVGQHSVTVKVTYNDLAHTVKTKTLSVNVGKPDILATTLTGLPYHPAAYDANNYGVGNRAIGTGMAGVTFNSTVSSTPTAGTFGFVQILTSGDYTIEYDSKTVKRTTPAGSLLVDCANNAPDVAIGGVWDSAPMSYTSFALQPRYDSPGLFIGLGGAEFPYSMTMNYSYQTSLVWRPSGGAYVAVDSITWTASVTATYNGIRSGFGAASQFMNPSYWTVTSNHNGPGPWLQYGDRATKLMRWTDNAEHGLPPAVTILK